MIPMGNDFQPQDHIPDVMSGNGFSVDVLIYCERTGDHTVGWFDYEKHVWNFLCREPVKDFVWRYFNDNDKPQKNETNHPASDPNH
jgi:hypothetical protein